MIGRVDYVVTTVRIPVDAHMLLVGLKTLGRYKSVNAAVLRGVCLVIDEYLSQAGDEVAGYLRGLPAMLRRQNI
jgi:hypothetical protein